MNANTGVSRVLPHQNYPPRFLLLGSTLEAYEVEEVDPIRVLDLFPEIISNRERQNELELCGSLLGFVFPDQNYPPAFLLLGSTLEAYEVEEIDPIQIPRFFPDVTADTERRDELEPCGS